MMPTASRAAVVCVDGDADVRQSLARLFQADYEFQCVGSPVKALSVLDKMGGAAVVMTSMCLAGMDGVEFLLRVRDRWPCMSRIVLTGDHGIEAAAAAVNQAGVFRYLLQPCPPAVLRTAVAEGVARHEERLAEGRVLDDTIHGAVAALSDVLSIVNPVAYGRAGRVQRHAVMLAQLVGHPADWELETAAMLSEIGYLFASPEAVVRIYDGTRLEAEDRLLASIAPSIARRLLSHIAHLAGPASIMEAAGWPAERRAEIGGLRGKAAGILSVATGFDDGLRRYGAAAPAIESLRIEPHRFETGIVESLASHYEVPALSAAQPTG